MVSKFELLESEINLLKSLAVSPKAYWEETFDERKDPSGGSYYWLTGEFKYQDSGEDTDIWALKNNYVSVVPTKFDLTDYDAVKTLNILNKKY